MPIEITVPGSKSIANRALVLKFLTGNKTKILNLPDCDDCSYMIKALEEIERSKSKVKLYTGNAGTTTRFLSALATLIEKEVIIDGDKRMRQRPIQELVSALNNLGAKVKSETGCPPLKIFPKKLEGGKVKLKGNISSQYLSALLMTTPFAKEDTVIDIEQNFYSKPYVYITLKILKEFRLKIVNKNFKQFHITGEQKPKNVPKFYTIEGDASSASYIGTYAALNPHKSILLKTIFPNSIQGDIKFLSYLKQMGCKTKQTNEGTLINGPKKLKSLGKIDMNKTPDLVMTFAVLAMFTEDKTTINNIANLRIKESDRIEALKNEIGKFGVKVETTDSSITIHGKDFGQWLKYILNKKIDIETYNDHRIAMSFGILKSIFPNLKIENPNCVSKSYTTFWQDLKKLQNG